MRHTVRLALRFTDNPGEKSAFTADSTDGTEILWIVFWIVFTLNICPPVGSARNRRNRRQIWIQCEQNVNKMCSKQFRNCLQHSDDTRGYEGIRGVLATANLSSPILFCFRLGVLSTVCVAGNSQIRAHALAEHLRRCASRMLFQRCDSQNAIRGRQSERNSLTPAIQPKPFSNFMIKCY